MHTSSRCPYFFLSLDLVYTLNLWIQKCTPLVNVLISFCHSILTSLYLDYFYSKQYSMVGFGKLGKIRTGAIGSTGVIG